MIQEKIELAIQKLSNEFMNDPYAFFTEADAVVRFHEILHNESSLNKFVSTKDGFKTSVIHREYPTFFRFDKNNPTAHVGPPYRRGHYDIVILNLEFVNNHVAATVSNRNIDSIRDESLKPIFAVIEFKFHDYGWAKNRVEGVETVFGKLKQSRKYSFFQYLVVFTRYRSPHLYRWDTYWPEVRMLAEQHSDINSIFNISWFNRQKKSDQFVYGIWSRTSKT
jgi:hypothetical protein